MPVMSYTHTQTVASTVWTVTHDLNEAIVSAQVLNSAGVDIIGDIEYIDTNTLNIKFDRALAGEAKIRR
jgi:hypothetical protein